MRDAPYLGEEHELLRDTVAAFARREIVPHQDEWERSGEIPRWVHVKAAEVGLLGLGFSEELGGSGGDLFHLLVAMEQLILSGSGLGIWAGLFSHGIALPPIVAAADPDQIDRWVRPTLDGRLVGALGVTEPGGGSDVARLRTAAVRDGGDFIVNGSKTYITSGCRADFVTTAVRTERDGRDDLSLLVIERGMPGFTASKKLEKMGWLSSDTAELSFVDVRVPASHLVGEEGGGFKQLMRNFQSERLLMAMEACGAGRRALDLAIEWANSRIVFGGPLSEKQVIRHKLAEMARQLDVAREYTLRTAARYLEGQDTAREVAMAKNTAVFACGFAVNEAVQILGGLGYMRESEVERLYRDVRILGIGGGTNEMMNEIIAKRIGLA